MLEWFFFFFDLSENLWSSYSVCIQMGCSEHFTVPLFENDTDEMKGVMRMVKCFQAHIK